VVEVARTPAAAAALVGAVVVVVARTPAAAADTTNRLRRTTILRFTLTRFWITQVGAGQLCLPRSASSLLNLRLFRVAMNNACAYESGRNLDGFADPDGALNCFSSARDILSISNRRMTSAAPVYCE
jgi:hypothetical protein